MIDTNVTNTGRPLGNQYRPPAWPQSTQCQYAQWQRCVQPEG